MNEYQFAEALGVSRGAVQQWERPGGTAPRRSNQSAVAALLGISVAELVTGGSNVDAQRDLRSQVPLVSEAQAGNYTAIDNFNPCPQFERVAVSVPVQRHTYALRVQGDSMVSGAVDSFPSGSIIVVEPELQAVPGDYVIALNGNNEITFKQLVQDGGDFFLKPLNSRYPIKLLGNTSIIGVVREFSKRFR